MGCSVYKRCGSPSAAPEVKTALVAKAQKNSAISTTPPQAAGNTTLRDSSSGTISSPGWQESLAQLANLVEPAIPG